MAQNDQVLATFQTRVRQMILRFQEMKKENAALHAELEASEQSVKAL